MKAGKIKHDEGRTLHTPRSDGSSYVNRRLPRPATLCGLARKAAHALTDVVIDTAERCHGRYEIEVARPAAECSVSLFDHLVGAAVLAVQ